MKLESIFYPLIGVLIIGLGIPLAAEKIGPNRWWGLRVAKTLSNNEVWYEANKVLGYDLVLAGAAILVISILLIFIDPRVRRLPVSRINVVVFLASIGSAVTHSLLALRRL